MAPSPTVVNTFAVTVNGTPLSEANATLLHSITVDNSLNLPDLAVVEFNDNQFAMLSDRTFGVGDALTISVTPSGGGPTSVFVGEITALEAQFDSLGAHTVLRAYDKTNRMMRGRKTKAWVQMSYSDVIQAIAGAAGVPTGQFDSTTPTYTQVSQANVEDWHFCRYLADQVGYTLAVVNGKLELTKPRAPTATDTPHEDSTDPLSYCPGDAGLVRLRAVVSSAGQVPSSTATGWDPSSKAAVTGDGTASALNASNSLQPPTLAGTFEAASFEASWSAISDAASATALAGAASAEIAGAYAEVEAEVEGNPALLPGVVVQLGGIGPLNGAYCLSATRHVYYPHIAYRTEFVVSDRRDRSLLGLVSGGGASEPEVHTMPSVATALVTNITDTVDGMCKVKLKFPWLSADYESDWVRTVQLGAGSSRGFQILPEVNDEVLVAFQQGDFGAPVVLGGLHNGQDTPPVPVDTAVMGGKVVKRMFQSRTGHILAFDESDSVSTISLISKDNETELILDAEKNQATLQAGKNIMVTSQGGQVTVTGPTGVTIKSDANITLQAGADLSIKATGAVSIQGATVSVQGQGSVSVQGADVSVQGEGSVAIAGAIVQIN